jgi:hypothetical protein
MDKHEAMKLLGHPLVTSSRGRHPLVHPVQTSEWIPYWDVVKTYFGRMTGVYNFTLPCMVSEKKDGDSVTVKPIADGIRVTHRTDKGGDCLFLDSRLLPEWTVVLGAVFNAELHATLDGKPLGFNKVPTVLKLHREETAFPPGLRLFIDVFGLQSLGERNAGEYDAETQARILQKLVPNKSGGPLTIRVVEAKRYDVSFNGVRCVLQFTDPATRTIVATGPREFLDYLLAKAQGTEGYVVQLPDNVFPDPLCTRDGFDTWRLHSSIKVRAPFRKMQLIVAGVTDRIDPQKIHDRYMYWAKRNERLEYAGEAPLILWRNLTKLPKPLGTIKSQTALKELRARGLDLRFLHKDNKAYTSQYEVEGTWITSKHHCVTGIKGMVKWVPTNAGLVSDTVEVAQGSAYWREVHEAGLRLEALLQPKRPRQGEAAAGAPPSKRRLTPIAPDLPRSKQAGPEEPEVGEGGGYVATDGFFRNLLVPPPAPAPIESQPEPAPAQMESQPAQMESQPESQPAPLEKQPEDFYNDATQPSMDPEADAETLEFHAEEHALSPVQEDPVTQVYEPQPEAEPELASQPVVEASLEPELASQPIVAASLEPELASQPIVAASLEPELASQHIVAASLEPELASQPIVAASPDPPQDVVPVETSLQRMARSNTAALDSACADPNVPTTRAMMRRFLHRLCDAVYDLSRDVHDPALWEAVKELVNLPVYTHSHVSYLLDPLYFRHGWLDSMPNVSPERRFVSTVCIPYGIRFRTVPVWFDYERWTHWRDETVAVAQYFPV